MEPEPSGVGNARAIEREEIALAFPADWTASLPAHTRSVERRVEAWLRAREVIRDDATAEKFRRLAVGEYANWPFPLADAERAEVITKFLALWIFYDDEIEEADDGQLERIHDAIAGRPSQCPAGDAHLRCWWELGRAYASSMSPAWVERHARRFVEWVQSVRDESRAAATFRAGGLPPPAIEHLARRRLNIGMMPNIDFIEYQLSCELPAELVDDGQVARIAEHAAEVVAIINDVFGLEKDRQSRWPNLVSCIHHEHGGPLEDAFERAAGMLHARVQAIVALEESLRTRVTDRRFLERWLRGLHHVMYGFARWHAMAPRYRASHRLDDGRSLQLVVRP